MTLKLPPGVKAFVDAAHLIPAKLVIDEIQKAEADCWIQTPERFHWTRNSMTNFQFQPPDHGDWNRIARAVWYRGRVIGVVSASMDRECLAVTELLAICYEPAPSVMFARALLRFVDELIDTHCNVRWSYVQGNPVGPKWERFAKRRGGEIVGHTRGEWLLDGKLHDRIWLWVPGRVVWEQRTAETTT